MELGCSVEGTDEDGRTVPHVAAFHNAPSVLLTLISPTSLPSTTHFLPFSPSHRDTEDNTPLHTAACSGALECAQVLVKRVQEDKEERVEDYLELKNYMGRTALHVAAFYSHTPIVEFLLSMVLTIKLIYQN